MVCESHAADAVCRHLPTGFLIIEDVGISISAALRCMPLSWHPRAFGPSSKQSMSAAVLTQGTSAAMAPPSRV